MTSTELERKVRQLDCDVHEIYSVMDKISVTQKQHGAALAAVQESLARVHGTQARHGNRLSEIDGHLEGIDSALTEMRATQARHGNRLDGIDGRLDRVDSRFDGVDKRFDRVESKLDAVLERLGPGPAGVGQGSPAPSGNPVAGLANSRRTDPPSGVPAHQGDESVKDRAVAHPEPVVLVLIGHPGAQAPDRGGCLQREVAGNVHVVEVDGGRGRHLVGTQPAGVVQARPGVPLGEFLRRVP